MILTMAEAKVALGLTASITDADNAMLEMLLPMVKSAIQDDPEYGLMYDPESVTGRVEYYPRNDAAVQNSGDGVWDVNMAGTKAFYQPWGRGDMLQLRHLPVRRIREIKVDFQGGFGQIADTFGNGTIYNQGEQFYLDLEQDGLNLTGQVFSRTGWPVGPGSIKVTYDSGYTADELAGRASTVNASGIKHAFLLTLVKAFRTFKANGKQGRNGFLAGPMISERLGDYQYQLSDMLTKSLVGMEVSVPPEAGQKLQSFRHYGLMVL